MSRDGAPSPGRGGEGRWSHEVRRPGAVEAVEARATPAVEVPPGASEQSVAGPVAVDGEPVGARSADALVSVEAVRDGDGAAVSVAVRVSRAGRRGTVRRVVEVEARLAPTAAERVAEAVSGRPAGRGTEAVAGESAAVEAVVDGATVIGRARLADGRVSVSSLAGEATATVEVVTDGPRLAARGRAEVEADDRRRRRLAMDLRREAGEARDLAGEGGVAPSTGASDGGDGDREGSA